MNYENHRLKVQKTFNLICEHDWLGRKVLLQTAQGSATDTDNRTKREAQFNYAERHTL